MTSDDIVWYADFSRGYLGRLDPATGKVAEWPSPSGPQSQPYGISAIDNVLWYSESGTSPNTVVRFDPKRDAGKNPEVSIAMQPLSRGIRLGTGPGNRGNPPFENLRHYFFDAGGDSLLAFFEMPKGAGPQISARKDGRRSMAAVQTNVCLILCNVRFDESRMFNFLYALKDMPAATATYRAIEVALEALDVPDFIDLPRLIAQHGPKCAVRERFGPAGNPLPAGADAGPATVILLT
jgi:hypothetical protein